jgi:hypothetical protein
LIVLIVGLGTLQPHTLSVDEDASECSQRTKHRREALRGFASVYEEPADDHGEESQHKAKDLTASGKLERLLLSPVAMLALLISRIEDPLDRLRIDFPEALQYLWGWDGSSVTLLDALYAKRCQLAQVCLPYIF